MHVVVTMLYVLLRREGHILKSNDMSSICTTLHIHCQLDHGSQMHLKVILHTWLEIYAYLLIKFGIPSVCLDS